MRGLFEGAKRKFLWTDRSGTERTVLQFEHTLGLLDWYVMTKEGDRISDAHVRTHDRGQLQTMAYLDDIRVLAPFENRGIGKLLIAEIIKECKKRGNQGIEGNLSESDQDHFDKLEYIYKKMGFSVEWLKPGDPGYSRSSLGKVRLTF